MPSANRSMADAIVQSSMHAAGYRASTSTTAGPTTATRAATSSALALDLTAVNELERLTTNAQDGYDHWLTCSSAARRKRCTIAAMSESSAVLSERRGSVLVVRLNRPDARNAVNGDVARGLEAAIDALESDDTLSCGVLAANGPVFCAGADLKMVASGTAAEMATPRGGFAGFVQRKRTKPIIAAVHSDALAGGFEIALACDLIVAAEGIKMGLPETKRSLVALGGGLVELPRLVGEKLAMELALTGDPLPIERLYALGAVNRVVPRAEVESEALALAARIGDNGPLAVRASYRILRAGRDLDTDATWKLSFEVGLPVFGSEDAREGAMAFVQKRKPEWKGR
jgi:enoyl-CoA hydratase